MYLECMGNRSCFEKVIKKQFNEIVYGKVDELTFHIVSNDITGYYIIYIFLKRMHCSHVHIGILQRQTEQRDGSFDAERLASASRRLQQNYKDVQNGWFCYLFFFQFAFFCYCFLGAYSLVLVLWFL